MTAQHWNGVYTPRPADSVSWYQARPDTSLRLLAQAAPDGPVLDVGGGTSTLADELLGAGRDDVTVLDVSAAALDHVRRRLGAHPGLRLVAADLLRWQPDRAYAAWHDRAVLHFLVDRGDQAAYARAAAQAVRPGGAAVMGVFAPDGPTSCSGLPTARHSADSVAALLGPAFELEHAEREDHITPTGSRQAFAWAMLRRSSV